MDLKLFGPEEGGLAYLQRDPTAWWISGDPSLTQALIDSIQGRQRFTAGVLSEIKTLDPKVREEAIHGVEYQLRAGLPPESLSFVWIGHTGKGRDESHFVVPDIEIITGCPFSPYVDRTDRHRFKARQEHFNLTHGLADPSSRLRVRPDYSKSRLPGEHQKLLMDVWEIIHKRVEAGLITNREEVVANLRSLGLMVRSNTYAGKPLEQPVLTLPDGALLRLRGSLYFRRDFTPDMLVPKQEQAKPEIIRARINELRGIVAAGLEFRAHHTIGHLFGRAEQRRVERGTARNHLAHLLRIKLSDWEVAEPIHPMFSTSGFKRLGDLIELSSRVDILQIPILQSIVGTGKTLEKSTSEMPAAGRLERVLPVTTISNKPSVSDTTEPLIPSGYVAAAKHEVEEKSAAPEVPSVAPPPAAISAPVIREKPGTVKKKKSKQKAPDGPTGPV